MRDLGIHVISNSNGTYSFVGTGIPADLLHYHRERMGPLTDEEIALVRQHGPGLFKWCGCRVFGSEAEARAAAGALGCKVAQ